MPSGPLEPVAHSAPHHDPGRAPQRYRCHVGAVGAGAQGRGEALLRYAVSAPPAFLEAVTAAAVFHDLGKLDEENQAALNAGRSASMPHDHVDAGVAHLLSAGGEASAWLVRAHHSPGLPSLGAEDANPIALRGERTRDLPEGGHSALIARVHTCLPIYLAAHERVCGRHPVPAVAADAFHGLPMRLALSCLVDADHTDSASYDAGVPTPMPAAEPSPCRWRERLARLEEAIARKVREAQAKGQTERVADRGDFFRACLTAPVDAALSTCGGPVGIGKTLAVTAHLLRRAADENLRHVFLVVPYTNIITQAVRELRAALVLPGEDPEEIVAEHHHRADFSSPESRDLATLWRAPVVITTAVQFFETLASNQPARLRKLHELPGSAIFLDEAHAALPARLWPQNWRWMKELAENWSCRFVFASGSLARFWTIDRIVENPVALPDLLGATSAGQTLQRRLVEREGERVRYESLEPPITVDDLCERVRTAAGPRLVILNTVQSAAVVAQQLNGTGAVVQHVSTALCPRDRDRILRRVKARLRLEQRAIRHQVDGATLCRLRDWTLVATSCVEAGVDLSFQTAFRERASAASLIQVGGRVNRHRERAIGVVHDFTFAKGERGITANPEWKCAAKILGDIFDDDLVNDRDPADVVTDAIRWELADSVELVETLQAAEWNRSYPTVATEGRLIVDDTALVVVDEALRERLEKRGKVSSTVLLRLSVQLRRHRVQQLGLAEIPGRREVYAWGGVYEPRFLGCMADTLKNLQFTEDAGAVI